jgi:hypothetical protein
MLATYVLVSLFYLFYLFLIDIEHVGTFKLER